MNSDHYRINVAVPKGTGTQYQRYEHLFYAVVDAIGHNQQKKANDIALTMQAAYPTAKVTITKWESRGHEVKVATSELELLLLENDDD